jgi:hypothetical protein
VRGLGFEEPHPSKWLTINLKQRKYYAKTFSIGELIRNPKSIRLRGETTYFPQIIRIIDCQHIIRRAATARLLYQSTIATRSASMTVSPWAHHLSLLAGRFLATDRQPDDLRRRELQNDFRSYADEDNQ